MKKLLVLGSAFVLTFGVAFVVVLTTPQPATALPPCEWQHVHWYFTDIDCFTPEMYPGHLATRCEGYNRVCLEWNEFGDCVFYHPWAWEDCHCVELCYYKPVPHEEDPPIQP